MPRPAKAPGPQSCADSPRTFCCPTPPPYRFFPAPKNPANLHKAVGFTPEEFHYAFTNTLSEEESKAVWDRYAIPASGNWVWAYGLIANFRPGPQETWVDYTQDRAPLLFIAGQKEGRDHWTCAAPGW